MNGDEEMELAGQLDTLDEMDTEVSLDEPKEAQEGAAADVSAPSPLPPAYPSPTLINLPSAGMWALKGDALLCFCRMMSSVSYTSEEEDGRPVWLCDGLTLAQEGAI